MSVTVALNGVHLSELQEKNDAKIPESVRTVNIDNEINSIAGKPTLLMLLAAIWPMAWSAVGAFHAYICVFTGFIPYNDWECIPNANGSRCLELLQHEEVGRAAMCDHHLKEGVDFTWTTERTSFSIDWHIYCDTEYKLALSSSLYFIGGVFGLLSSAFIFEKFGRKRGAQCMGVATILVLFIQPLSQSFEMLIIIRMIQGFTQLAGYLGAYIWVLEFMPTNLRTHYNTTTMLVWAIGYLIIVAVSYLITQWEYICVALNLISCIALVPLFIFPESPRCLLNLGKIEETKKALEALSSLGNERRTYENVTFVTDEEQEELSVAEQLSLLKKYPVFLKEELLQIYFWVVIALLFYGFNYSWSSFGKSLYSSYLYAAIGETIAYLILIPLSYMCGRNPSLMILMSGATVSFIIAAFTLQFERLFSLIGTMFISASYGLIYVYTGELTPTTHRGFIMSTCSLLATVGSFAGPQVSLIFSAVSREVPLIVFALLSAGVVLSCCFLPETAKLPIPETALDVHQRSLNKEPITLKLKVKEFVQMVRRVTGGPTEEGQDSVVVENSAAKC